MISSINTSTSELNDLGPLKTVTPDGSFAIAKCLGAIPGLSKSCTISRVYKVPLGPLCKNLVGSPVVLASCSLLSIFLILSLTVSDKLLAFNLSKLSFSSFTASSLL